MRGEQENACLERVKEHLKMNSARCYCNNLQKICGFLKSAIPNPAQSNFPDFLFENGFIEHFQITAAKESKKGSVHKQTQARFYRETAKKFQQMSEALEKAMPENSLTCEVKEMKTPLYTYEQYMASFQRNWQHHINSLQKYTGCREIGIFLVEYQGPVFKMLCNRRLVDCYWLHKDIGMLEYIASYKDQLSYVIFVDSLSCEVIKLDDIPALIKQVPADICFEPGRLKQTCIHFGVNVATNGFEDKPFVLNRSKELI